MPIIDQMDPFQKGSKRPCGLPSIIIANYLMRGLEDGQLLNLCLPGYLNRVRGVYNLSQDGANKMYQKGTFTYCIETVALIFERLQNDLLEVNLGEVMSRSSFWVMSINALQS